MTARYHLGERFGRLKLIGPVDIRAGHRVYVMCKCDCGREKYTRLDGVVGGLTLSCGKSGCYRSEVSALKRTRHGLSRSSEYGVWVGMIYRCERPKASNYPLYGGRGITVCARWHSLAHFVADMGPRPSRAYSIDRIDSNGHYEPGNCRWATALEQAANTCRTVKIVCDGETISLNDAWKVLGHGSQSKLYRAIQKQGFSPQDAFDHFRLAA